MNRIAKVGLLLIAVALGIGTFFYANRSANREDGAKPAVQEKKGEPGVLRFAAGAPQLASIRVRAVEEFPVPLAEPLNGRIAYDENATARVSSPILGRIVKLNASPGDSVRLGDALLVLDSPDLAQAAADVAKARADEQRKKQAFERSKLLLDAGVIPGKDFESAEADFLQARAETQRADLRLRNLNARGASDADGHFSLRSPISGVVADRQANPGMEVRPDLPNPLFVVTDPTRLWVMIDLPEHTLPKVAVGHPVAVEVDAYPNERFRATVQRIGQTVDPVTRRIQVRCTIANPERKLKPEMYARATLLANESKRAVRVPTSALIIEGLYSFIFVELEPGVFEKRRVRLGVQQDRDYSYIESGLEPGTRIVTVGPLLLSAELKTAN
jgi:cobalt-zinc-cadmium efflux system membrane fusion protein